jgi:uncharacterized membrane protein
MAALLTKLRAIDSRRPGIPGEHWMVAAAGTSLLRAAFKRRSTTGRVLLLVAAGALLARAASGRDGVASALRR